MKTEFYTVKDAILEIDIAATRDKISNSAGMATLMKSGSELEQAQNHAVQLLRFIDTGDAKRELEAELRESGKIDFTNTEGEEEELISGDYFNSIIVLKRLLRSWKSRRNNVTEMKRRT
jgi:hypothetical protein